MKNILAFMFIISLFSPTAIAKSHSEVEPKLTCDDKNLSIEQGDNPECAFPKRIKLINRIR
ncbi:hypothetical protein ACWIUH_11970 [Ursidibacter arcticus]